VGWSLLALAAASGIADVDAISLSIAGMTDTDLRTTTVAGVVTAAATESVTKRVRAMTISGRPSRLPAAIPLAL
jgi:uncharacterized membrane protein (DUF4010 family)